MGLGKIGLMIYSANNKIFKCESPIHMSSFQLTRLAIYFLVSNLNVLILLKRTLK